ncbi:MULTISPECIES: 8-oxo-dGTP diphosphatase MutT [Paenibacillus]|uniref:8-oxo-dGTP diphosphatase n=1 Tax=Paenibacillus agri TaxID=2744309 RepID=A0A850F011_9BACL|nr:8-oxo-dGTP diphosphatase MutT [Paenibacillus agri]NUU63421.1 8-oxo-dGTP diphosphatase MutT [Paenibacillus agri]
MIEVAAAIIYDETGKILIARRREGKSQGGLWEFPGGKLEAGESVQDCLIRELQEEMGIEIRPYAAFGVNEHSYGSVHLTLIAWKAKYVNGTITLTDHDEYRWVQPGELGVYTFAAADIPFVERLMRND